jgi:hypothetical protein
MTMRDLPQETPIHSAQCTVMMTPAQHRQLKVDAENYGYSLSGLIRMRMFNQVQGMRALRKPRVEVAMLGQALCQLTAQTGALQQHHDTLVRMAQQLTRPERDLFGVESSLQGLQTTQQKILQALLILEAAVMHATSPTHAQEEPHG